jgi:hypothetical protein
MDTGTKMNIIPEELSNQLGFVTTKIFMRLRGIGGHFTPIVGLAKNVDFSIFPGHENLANFFIVKGSVHTVFGRPFLADHKVRLELSNKKGEVLSFQDPLGKRLCIPICLPNVPGWHREPPMFQQNCSLQVVDWDILDQIKNKDVDKSSEDTLEANWKQLEKDKEYQKVFSSTLHPPRLETRLEESTKGKDKQQEDPWNMKLAKPLNWVKELGGYKFTDEEQERIDQQFAQSEVAWAAELKHYNSKADYYWKDKSFLRQFRNVFDKSKRPKTLRRNQGWLAELPGGFTDLLDFLQILDSTREKAFVRCGNWSSRFGFVSRKVREKSYYGGGKNWYRINISKPAKKRKFMRKYNYLFRVSFQ